MFGMMEALLSFIRRQIGLRSDMAEVGGSLHSKVRYINENMMPRAVQASNTVKIISATERTSTDSTKFVKMKEIRVLNNGTVRVSFDLKGASSIPGYGKIYLNGVEISTQKESVTWNTFTQDIVVKSGDLIQIYIRAYNESYSASTRNLSIGYDFSTNMDVITLD